MTGIFRGSGTSGTGVSQPDVLTRVAIAGDTMTGYLNVPAGATGTQVPQSQEVTHVTTLAAAGGALLVGNTPAGNIAATTVQAALNELDAEKALLAGSATQVFSVASGTGSQAINKTQADSTYAALAGLSTQVFSAAAAVAAANVVRADQNKNELTSVSATIATGKLTFGLQPCIINFRNSDVTNGAPNTKFVSAALTLATDNNGASFGLTTAIQGRLIMLAVDNGTATPVLGVVNLSGGISLTEEGVLTSTTAITGAVVSATTVYTTVALGAGLYPYKVVGAVDITWTSGSGFITTPALVTGAGGNALTAMSSLGYGSVQRNGVDITRVLNTTYYTGSRPRFVAANITIATATDVAVLLVNGNIVQEGYASAVGNYSSVGLPIPPYSSYLIKQSGNPTSGAIRYWSEL